MMRAIFLTVKSESLQINKEKEASIIYGGRRVGDISKKLCLD